jgi:hypothetical protein
LGSSAATAEITSVTGSPSARAAARFFAFRRDAPPKRAPVSPIVRRGSSSAST